MRVESAGGERSSHHDGAEDGHPRRRRRPPVGDGLDVRVQATGPRFPPHAHDVAGVGVLEGPALNAHPPGLGSPRLLHDPVVEDLGPGAEPAGFGVPAHERHLDGVPLVTRPSSPSAAHLVEDHGGDEERKADDHRRDGMQDRRRAARMGVASAVFRRWEMMVAGDGSTTVRVPPRWFVRTAWAVHRFLVAVTGGRLGLWRPKPGGWGTLRLTTIGRRSGREHRVILGYVEDGPNLVTMAMNGWGEGEPAWWLNLQAHPEAGVQIVGRRLDVRAHAAEGTERERLWDLWRTIDDDLDEFAALRSTETAVVVLGPAD